MPLGVGTALNLRPASPQPSKHHGRDPLTSPAFKKSSKVSKGDTDLDPDDAVAADDDDDDSDPIENVTDSASWRPSSPSPRLLPAASQNDWYRFPAPTQRDAKRSGPYIDNVTRLKTKLAKVAAAGAAEPATDSEAASTRTEWDFKMVGPWRVGELLGKGTSGA